MRSKTLAITWISVLTAVGSSAMAEAWKLTLADFRSEVVALKAIDADGLTVESGGAARRVALTDFVELRRAGLGTPVSAAPFTLELAGGDRVPGEPVAIADEQVIWRNALVGEVRVPLSVARAIVRQGTGSPIGDTPAEDQVKLLNGDLISGIINTLDKSAVNLKSTAGDAVAAPLPSIAMIRFAVVAGGAPETKHAAFRLRLADGTVLAASTLTVSPTSLRFSAEGATNREVALSTVAAIEQVNGPIAWLSSLPPSESVQTPHLGAARPAHTDESVTGDPIRSADGSPVRGIGVASKSFMSWELNGGYQFFRTRYGIAGELPYADVTVRILLDDKVMHEQTHVRAATPGPPISIELGSARKLTLEVDYGDTFDVQDFLNWIEPALSKTAPTTQP